MINEDKLVSQLRSGNIKAFNTIYNLYWNKLFYSAKIRLDSIEEVEDILHDLFLDLWKNRDSLYIRTSLSAYLYTSLKYKIFRLYDYKSVRENHKNNLKSEDIYNLEDELNFNDLYDLIEQKVEQLPEKCRVVFKLSRFEGKNINEISEELCISKNTAQNHINKALKFLRKEINDKNLIFIF